ncbi:MAG: DUF1361 domain-containing protein [Bacillaceae bacterium]|nr:DUF1361 domain-containing protein [Bacillaceae bacterium]
MRFSAENRSGYKHVILFLLLLSMVCGLMVMLRNGNADNRNYLFLAWNLFLAWIPLLLALGIDRMLSKRYTDHRTGKIMALGVAWLLFYPNAPYMITDFIHFNYMNFIHFGDVWTINDDIWVWYDFVMFALFVWSGFLLGFVSLFIIHRLIDHEWSNILAWMFVGLVCVLSGFAIYLGRFIRWNSWDVLVHPVELVRSLSANFNAESVLFSLMFGLFLILVYGALYQLTLLHRNRYPV